MTRDPHQIYKLNQSVNWSQLPFEHFEFFFVFEIISAHSFHVSSDDFSL